jgi:dienelactone hydrolase
MSDLELTWYKAETALPSALGGGMERMSDPARREALQNAPRKFPVVLYLHGCTGMSGEDRDLMEALARAGYVVIGPDSMARRFRPLQCSSWSKDGGFNLFVFDFRQAEINFALQQMAGSKWADWDNLFVVGVSEGGLAAAHFRGDVFRARVITQWTCHGSTWVRGIDGPSDTPVLSVVRKDDPWYTKEGSTQSGDCGAYFGDNRPGSRSMVLDKGSDHAVMGDKSVVSAIVSFLDANRR